jgi:outer membrane protein assembly factor BamD
MHYIRVRKAVDPAIIYFKDVVQTYPTTKSARLAWLRLHELYTKIRWKEDAAETCEAMWTAYPGDADVRAACGVRKAVAAPDTTRLPQAAPVRSPQGYARPAPR